MCCCASVADSGVVGNTSVPLCKRTQESRMHHNKYAQPLSSRVCVCVYCCCWTRPRSRFRGHNPNLTCRMEGVRRLWEMCVCVLIRATITCWFCEEHNEFVRCVRVNARMCGQRSCVGFKNSGCCSLHGVCRINYCCEEVTNVHVG